MRLAGFLAVLCLGAGFAHAAAPDDPLHSANWAELKKAHFPNQRIVFDNRVKVTAPKLAEDSMNVPIGVSAEALPDVEEVVVLADHNPIVKVLQFYPYAAKPALSFRLKLQQASPIRALARTRDGVWHAGGVWVDAAGGGCTAPSVGRASGSWTDTLNQVQSRVWNRDGAHRLRLRIMHPMDTGLAPGIPAFYIERLSLTDATGRELMRVLPFEPVSENPVFSFDFPPGKAAAGPLTLTGVDNNGNRIQSRVVQ